MMCVLLHEQIIELREMDQGELWTDIYDIHHCGEYTRFTTYCNSLANKIPVHMMVLYFSQWVKRVRKVMGLCFSVSGRIV